MIKKLCCLTLLLVVAVKGICTAVNEKPEEGLWYCSELSMSLDFSEYAKDKNANIGRFYFDNGHSIDIKCYFDYGKGVSFSSPCELEGEYKYEDDVFYIIAIVNEEEHTYIFERVDKTEDK